MTTNPHRRGRCLRLELRGERVMSNIIWIIVIGFVAGLIARLLSAGENNPTGFVLTTALGIAGAFVATFIGQTIGWYRLDQGAGLIGATVGALIVLFIWNRLVAHRVILRRRSNSVAFGVKRTFSEPALTRSGPVLHGNSTF